MSRNTVTVDRVLHNAKTHAKRGEADKARALYLAVLECYPKNRRAIKGLQSLDRHRQQTVPNERLTQHQVDQLVDLYRRGRHQDVVRSGMALSVHHSNEPVVFNLVGASLSVLGRRDEAVVYYRRALAVAPDYQEAHYNLGNALLDQGKPEDAVACYQRALELNPDHAEAHNNLGNALMVLARHEEAVVSFGKAVELEPDRAVSHGNLGTSFNELGRYEAATACLKRAVQLDPGLAYAHNNLGTTFNFLGQTENAIESFEEAIRLDPDYADAHRNLSTLRMYGPGDPHVAQLEVVYERLAGVPKNRSSIAFALGKAHDDIGNTDRAFRYFEEANRLMKQEFGYDRENDRVLFDRIRSVFRDVTGQNRPETWNRNVSPRPIFVVGMPRSGTTLVESILASHSGVYGAGELPALGDALLPAFRRSGDASQELLSAGSLNAIRRSYLEQVGNIGDGSPHVVDKMPSNFRWIGFIAEAFPEARIINLKRSPEAVCWSIYKHCFPGSANGFTCDLGDIAHYWNLYTNLMEFWRERHPGLIFDLDYEALTENQRNETAKLLAHCGLDWEDRCLDFHRTERAVRTASSSQVRKRLYRGSSDAWKKYEPYLRPLLDGLTDKPVADRNAA